MNKIFPIDKLPSDSTVYLSPIKFIKQPTVPLSFRTGEILSALVMENLDNDQVLLKVKESIIMALSEFPLKVGDNLKIKVENTHPQVIFSVKLNDDENVLLKSHLATFRSFPDGMLNVIKNGLDIFQSNILLNLPFIEKTETESIIKLIDSLIYSEKNSENQLYFKDYIQNIGYLLENSLKKMSETGEHAWQPTKKNLKMLLTELSVKLHQVINSSEESDLELNILQTLKSLAKYADTSLETIYNQQVINVVGQEEHQGYFFQIPIKFAEELQMADIFINSEGRRAKENKSCDEFQFVIFLNMDVLGDIMVDVKYNQKRIIGTFKCDRADSVDIIKRFLETLNNRLNLSGYGPNYLNVSLSQDLKKERADFAHTKMIFAKTIINCFA